MHWTVTEEENNYSFCSLVMELWSQVILWESAGNVGTFIVSIFLQLNSIF